MSWDKAASGTRAHHPVFFAVVFWSSSHKHEADKDWVKWSVRNVGQQNVVASGNSSCSAAARCCYVRTSTQMGLPRFRSSHRSVFLCVCVWKITIPKNWGLIQPFHQHQHQCGFKKRHGWNVSRRSHKCHLTPTLSISSAEGIRIRLMERSNWKMIHTFTASWDCACIPRSFIHLSISKFSCQRVPPASAGSWSCSLKLHSFLRLSYSLTFWQEMTWLLVLANSSTRLRDQCSQPPFPSPSYRNQMVLR